MAEEMNMMDEKPLQANMPEEARTNLMNPSESIQAVLMTRLTEMSREELNMLDKAITPEVSRVLMKLLPELAELIKAVENQDIQEEDEMMPSNMGALGNV